MLQQHKSATTHCNNKLQHNDPRAWHDSQCDRNAKNEKHTVCCRVLQCVASALQCVAVCCRVLLCNNILQHKIPRAWHDFQCDRNTKNVQHTATHCTILHHTATHCNTLQHTATHCSTLQHTAAHCNIGATHCNTLQHTLQHTATHCSDVVIHNRGSTIRTHSVINSQTI